MKYYSLTNSSVVNWAVRAIVNHTFASRADKGTITDGRNGVMDSIGVAVFIIEINEDPGKFGC